MDSRANGIYNYKMLAKQVQPISNTTVQGSILTSMIMYSGQTSAETGVGRVKGRRHLSWNIIIIDPWNRQSDLHPMKQS